MNRRTLSKLMKLPGIPGQEDTIIYELIKKMKQVRLDIERDNLGSVWAIKKSVVKNAPTVLIDAHMDEVGFQVTGFTDDGLIKFEEQGFIQKSIMMGLRLDVWTKSFSKAYVGVVLSRKSHSSENMEKIPEINELLLDVGAKNKTELEEMEIELGSTITFEGDAKFQANSVIGKAVDNRAGVAIIHELLDFISKRKFNFDIIIGSSVQEEVGLRGARVTAYKYNPDLAIIIDVSPANDFYKQNKKAYEMGKVGGGTLIRYKDALTVFPKSVTNYLEKVAKDNSIEHQNYFGSGGTNSGIIHIMNSGIITIPLGFVARNLHTPSQIFDITDYENTLKFAKSILLDLTVNKIKTFRQF